MCQKEDAGVVCDITTHRKFSGRGEYWGLGVFLLQYFPLVKI